MLLQERVYPTLDAVHALLIAAYDATRFLTGSDLAGLVERLRRTAAAVNEAVVYAVKRLEQPAGRDELLRARGLLRELGEYVQVARHQGLDLAAAAELLEYQGQAGRALKDLADALQAPDLAA